MLGAVSQQKLNQAAASSAFLAHMSRVAAELDRYLSDTDSWYRRTIPDFERCSIAYFSAEFGLTECLSIFAGGLGILAGDHLKSSSDLGLNLTGIGLLYQQGYFLQYLNEAGWQQERYVDNDFHTLPLSAVTSPDSQSLKISVDLPGRPLAAQIWRVDVGRVPLFLLDTNIPDNDRPEDRDVTDQLYGGDQEMRLKQEILLGIGGYRALEALGRKPVVFHMNEGHSAFLALEHTRRLMETHRLNFEEARILAQSSLVFTGHTPVMAGHDFFPPELMARYFTSYAASLGLSFRDFMALGRQNPSDDREPFCMTVLALRMSSFRNGVSKLHGEVSRQMWRGLWPGIPLDEIPIGHITNGVHFRSWISYEMNQLYDRYLGPDWREEPFHIEMWSRAQTIPPEELWRTHERRRERLVAFARRRLAQQLKARGAGPAEIAAATEALDPDILTIGFARRFATYKRATLIFRDIERLKRIVNNTRRPVQILIAGKAHPQDIPGKTLIREIIHHANDPDLRHRVMFVEDYGMQVARELVGAVDVWLNTPRRGEEACGTSGMKAGMNGVLNLSIPDGWFDEAAEESGGWSIGGREEYSPERDDSHAASIYSLLENEILPLYYENREHGVPVEWMRRVKQSLKFISANYNCQRMVEEYRDRMYIPAHAAFAKLREGQFDGARERVRWSRRVAEAWPQVRFQFAGLEGEASSAGAAVTLVAEIDLGPLSPPDVRVEALVGRVNAQGELTSPEVVTLEPRSASGSVWRFTKEYRPKTTGRLGVAARVSSNHFENPLNRPCNTLMKWAGR
jgi:starch phosphorylase